MAVKHHRLTATLALQASDRVVTFIANWLHGRIETRGFEDFVHGPGHVPLVARRAGDIGQVDRQLHQAVPADLVNRFGDQG